MKTKQQKRLEAIRRLERAPRNDHRRLTAVQVAEVWEARKAEAFRLRLAFSEYR